MIRDQRQNELIQSFEDKGIIKEKEPIDEWIDQSVKKFSDTRVSFSSKQSQAVTILTVKGRWIIWKNREKNKNRLITDS